MSRAALALLGIALVVSLGQWLSMRIAGHVDMGLLPAHSRRRVQRVVGETRHIQLACALLAVSALGIQLAA